MTSSKKNHKVDVVLSKAKRWREEMEKLRTIVLECGLTEELKWYQPCYTFEGRNVVLIHGFKEYFALLFIKGVLLKDPRKILIQQTENVQAGRQVRFTNLREVVEVEKSGLEVKMKKTTEFKVPVELKNKFARTPALKTAFHALTPGRQRAYLLYFAAPKQSKTREARIEKCMPQILKGKGLMDDYLLKKKNK
jgi:uncharacterized protein YdeI (YjbR/CyaY-like superfamily)